MATFHVAPGVYVNEIDLTLSVGAVSTTDAALAGPMRWGPVDERVLVSKESELVSRFGKPTNFNAETWFTGASFLAYSTRLHVSRAANTTGVSPVVTADVEAANVIVELASGNTSELSAGLILVGSSNTAVVAFGVVNAIINATAFDFVSSSSAAGSGSGVTLQFASNTAFTAVSNTGTVANLSGQIVKNEEHYETIAGTFDSDVQFVARYPGALGNGLRVSVCGNSTGYTTTINLASATYGTNTNFTVETNSNTLTIVLTAASQSAANTAADAFVALINVNDILELGNTVVGTQLMKITAIDSYTSNSTAAIITVHLEDTFKLVSNVAYGKTTSSNTLTRYWEFYNKIDKAPDQSQYVADFGNTSAKDELHVIVVDDKGKFTGVPGTVLEVYESVSRATDAKAIDGEANFWRTVINDRSQYIWAVNALSGGTENTAINIATATLDVSSHAFVLGNDGADEQNLPIGLFADAYDLFASAEDVDISLIMTGRASNSTLPNYLVDNIADVRKDCVVFISPRKSDVVNNKGFEGTSTVTFRNLLRASSYAFMDNNYKYMYDRYNDVYRWIPMNGDTAGLCARTDETNDPWWSPAGFNRGKVKNVIKLAYNPRKADIETLYKADVNSFVTFNGQGTVLYGDKTMLGKQSAFSRINVRRLFITLEKAISTAARFSLFEFNDVFTRNRFLNMVNPYLRTVKAKRGMYGFLAKCDEDNNTAAIIDNNEFVGDIIIKPSRSINAVTLNFVAIGTDVQFSEIEGQF